MVMEKSFDKKMAKSHEIIHGVLLTLETNLKIRKADLKSFESPSTAARYIIGIFNKRAS